MTMNGEGETMMARSTSPTFAGNGNAPRSSRPTALAELLENCMAPALASQGFASGDVIAAWEEIVGPNLAAFSQPIKLEWPRRHKYADPESRPDPATLVVRVEGAFALDFQQSVPLVIERLNAHYGWACIGRVVIRQGPVARPPERVVAPAPVDPRIAEQVAQVIAAVEDAPLKAALARFGEAVLGRDHCPKHPGPAQSTTAQSRAGDRDPHTKA
jgi:hypothetical protein